MATMKLLGHLLLLLLCCCSADGFSAPSAVCADSRMPVVLLKPLAFCGNGGLSCCDPAADAALREEFQAMDVPESDAACATIVKAILCQRCIPSAFPQPVNTTSTIPPWCASRPPPPTSSAPQPQHDAVCLERLAGGSTATGHLAMVARPDGSERAFLYTWDGKVSLASLPPPGSGAALQVVAPFLDLTGRALLLTGLALHPDFVANGRFFVSYACDGTASPACGAAAAAAGNGSRWPCRYQLVVAEFIAKGVDHGMAAGGAPTEVRRIFTTGVPQLADASSNQQHGGQIFFRPGHSYLYLVTGHGGDGDEAAFPFLGKIIRFDIDGMAAGNEPQIFATGLLWDPRGCSFDSERPSYLYCAGVDEQQNEQVYLISNKQAANQSAMAAVSLIIGHGRPTPGEAPSIVGGILYRGPADPFLSGRFVYIYDSSVWAAAETPAGTGHHVYPSARIPKVRCSTSSPVPCAGVAIAIAGSVISLGQDNSKDAFIITTGGIYRVIPPGLCGGAPHPRASATPPETAAGISWLLWAALISIPGLPITAFAIYFFRACLFGCCRGDDEEQATRTDCSFTWNCIFQWACCFCGNTEDGDGGRGGIDGIELAA